MKDTTKARIDQLICRYPILEGNRKAVFQATEELIACYQNGGKLLVCGNGGSASDALHIVGELMKSFVLPRKLPDEMKGKLGEYIFDHLQGALPAIALVSETALQTAYANDMAPDLDFAQQVYGYGAKGDVLLGITTSGNSKNVLYAAKVAREKGMKVIGLTGLTGGKMKEMTDVLINVPEKETFMVQELHLPVYHTLCLALENEFFGD